MINMEFLKKLGILIFITNPDIYIKKKDHNNHNYNYLSISSLSQSNIKINKT